MYCGKCGTQNADGAAYCKGCGAPLATVQRDSAEAAAPYPVDVNQKNRTVGIVAVAAVAALALILLLVLFSGRSYKSTISKLMDASFDADARAIMGLIPNEVVDAALADSGYDRRDINKLYDEMSEELEDALDDLEWYYGDDWSYSYEITGAENLSSKELRKLKETYEEYDVKVSAAKNVEVELTVRAADTEGSNTIEIPVIKVGLSWYLDVENFSGLF